LIRDRKLVSSGVLMGRLHVFSGGLEAGECLSKNEIRSKSLLCGVCFDFFIGILLIYDTFTL
jgi:hypothetical protein